MDNDPKQKKSQEFIKPNTWDILQWPSQSLDLKTAEYAFQFLRTQMKAEKPTDKQLQ